VGARGFLHTFVSVVKVSGSSARVPGSVPTSNSVYSERNENITLRVRALGPYDRRERIDILER